MNTWLEIETKEGDKELNRNFYEFFRKKKKIQEIAST